MAEESKKLSLMALPKDAVDNALVYKEANKNGKYKGESRINNVCAPLAVGGLLGYFIGLFGILCSLPIWSFGLSVCFFAIAGGVIGSSFHNKQLKKVLENKNFKDCDLLYEAVKAYNNEAQKFNRYLDMHEAGAKLLSEGELEGRRQALKEVKDDLQKRLITYTSTFDLPSIGNVWQKTKALGCASETKALPAHESKEYKEALKELDEEYPED